MGVPNMCNTPQRSRLVLKSATYRVIATIMKHFRRTNRQTQHTVAALILTGILSIGASTSFVNVAAADSVGSSQGVANLKQSSQLPVSVINAIRRDIFRTTKTPPGQLGVVSFSQQSWPNSCLGLGQPGEACAEIFIENGWRVVMSDGRQKWVYRSDSTGRTVRSETAQNPSSSNLPDSVSNAVLLTAAKQLGVPTSQLKITQAQQQNWSDRCLGLGSPVELCASALTPGWRVTVEGKQQRLVYHTDRTGSLIRLNQAASGMGNVSLPQPVADAVLRFASQDLGASSSQLRITKAQQQTWPDSCLGLPRPTERCMGTSTPGWQVTVEGRQKVQVYRTDSSGSRIRAEQIAGQPNNLPDSVSRAVLQDASRRLNLSTSALSIVQAERRDWPNGCLGLAEPGVFCTQAIVPGWQVTVEGGKQPLVYRTNESGSVIKLESGSTQGNIAPVPISRSELPPPLSGGVVFRAIQSGGFTGQTTETILINDGRVIRRFTNSRNMVPTQMRQISRQELRQFQQLLAQQNFAQFDKLAFPASKGAADYISVTLTSESGTTRYADMVQNQLPQSLQTVIQAWNQIASTN